MLGSMVVRSWKALFEGQGAADLLRVVDAIAADLEVRSRSPLSAARASELALFYTYIDVVHGSSDHDALVDRLLGEAVERLSRETPLPALFGGFAEVAATMDNIRRVVS